MRIEVVIADDHPLSREGVRQFLEMEGDIEVVGEASDGLELLSLIEQQLPGPDVALVDARMPRMDGVEATKRIRRGLAAAVIIGAPIISELPVFRRTIVGRLLRTAAVGTLLIKGAEWVRDWEPARPIDLGPT